MAATCHCFWSPENRASYLDKAASKLESAQRLMDGEDTAADLSRIWQSLSEPERDLIRALLAIDRRSFIAPHDAPALRNLVAAGLLRYPRGQGGAWMRASRTSYTVPPAVWREFQAWDRDLIFVSNQHADITQIEARVLLDWAQSGTGSLYY